MDLGGKRVRNIDTPHVPHNWESHLLYEETTGTLLCGDLFSSLGDGSPALSTDDPIEPAIEAEDMFHATSITPSTPATMRRLADLKPKVLAVMHGPSYQGDGGASLRALADEYERRYLGAATG